MNQRMSTQEFEDVYHRYKQLLFRIAFSYVKKREDAEDLVQEAYYKDEEGCSVSAHCEVVGKDKGTAVVRKKNMNCDRPFLVVNSDWNGMPIFAGAVNQPNSCIPLLF